MIPCEATVKRSDGVAPRAGSFVTRRARRTAATLRRFVVPAALLLLTNCASSPQGDRAASDNRAVRLQSFATIEAAPNPVPAGQNVGTTTITWTTGNYSVGQVYVSVDGGPEKLFARGSAGAAEAAWVTPDSACEFRLYTDAEPRALLATVTVRGARRTSAAGLARLAIKAVGPAGIAHLVLLLAMFAVAYLTLKKGAPLRPSTVFSSAAIVSSALALAPVLLSEPRPLKDQPFPDAHELSDATRQLVSGHGYVTTTYTTDPRPPRSPPGFALALAPFAALGRDFPANVQTGAKVFAALYVLAAVAAAWLMGGPLAAALVATLIGVSPFARVASTLVMSDAFGAGGTVLLVVLLHRLTPARVSLAGGIAGALVSVRLPLVLNLVALFLALPGKWRMRLALSASPPVAALSIWQWTTFGSPFKTGYDYWMPDLKPFGWPYALMSPPRGDGPWIFADVLNGFLAQWSCPCPLGGAQAALPNVLFYPVALLGFFWVYAPPFITAFGMFSAWRRRDRTPARFALWLTALSFAFFCFYHYQGVRFMAAPATLLTVFASVMLAGWGARLIDTVAPEAGEAVEEV